MNKKELIFRLLWKPKVGQNVNCFFGTRKIVEILGDNQFLLDDRQVYWINELNWEPTNDDIKEIIALFPVRLIKLAGNYAELQYNRQFIVATGKNENDTLKNLVCELHVSSYFIKEFSTIFNDLIKH